MALRGLEIIPRESDTGGPSGRLDHTGDSSLVDIHMSAASGRAMRGVLDVLQYTAADLKNHDLIMTKELDWKYDWKLDLIIEIDNFLTFEIDFRFNCLTEALSIWVLHYRSPLHTSSLLRITEVYHFEYYFDKEFFNFLTIIYAIMVLMKPPCKSQLHGENDIELALKSSEEGKWLEYGKDGGERQAFPLMEKENVVESSSKTKDASKMCEIEETNDDSKYGAVKESFTNRHFVDKMETDSSLQHDQGSMAWEGMALSEEGEGGGMGDVGDGGVVGDDGDEGDESDEGDEGDEGDRSDGGGRGRWWARAARSVRWALLSCFGCGK